MKTFFSRAVFYVGFGLSCALLAPACLLLMCVSLVWNAADKCATRLEAGR